MSNPDVAIAGPRFRFPLRYRLERLREAAARTFIRIGLRLVPDSTLTAHARRELEIAGLFDDDSDYGGMLGGAVIDMMKLFALEGHSGFSANYAISLFEKCGRFEPLTPLTGADDEWFTHDYGDGTWQQNKRCSHVFKDKDGRAYDIEGRIFREPDGSCYTSSESRVYITFPYVPTREYIDVPESGK